MTSGWGLPDESTAVAAAALAGRYASADTVSDKVVIRNIDQTVVRAITRAEISALLPWMNLDASGDGPGAIAFSDSGRLLFIAVHDAATAGDAQPSDAILRYDVLTDSLGLFVRMEIFSSDASTHGSLAHYKGRLYVGVPGGVRVFRAQMNDLTGISLTTAALTPGVMVTGLAIDRTQSTLYASSGGTISRAPITAAQTLPWTAVGVIANTRSLAYSEHFGGPLNAGLYALASDGSTGSLQFLTPDQARGNAGFAPASYLSAAEDWRDLAGTADGQVLLSSSAGTKVVRDTTDPRMNYAAWMHDEFTQVVNFGKSLVTTGPGNGGPAGWVIDGDVQIGWSRFHPATPDAAAWTVLLLIASDRLTGDPSALPTVRTILTRYGGLAADGVRPSRSADGIFRHWIDPNTGGVKSGWDPEFATMSTMKIVLAAARARAYWPGDAAVRDAASAIICAVSNYDAYFTGPAYAMALKGFQGGGATAFAAGFHEGILFVEQAATYGGPQSASAWMYWQSRGSFASATLVNGHATATNVANSFLPAFVSMYPLQLISTFRNDPAWGTHVQNLRISNAAWTDDNGPKYGTVFSAGTTKGEWGGYNADSLTNHPGDVTTFTSLEAICAGSGPGTALAGPQSVEAVGAYQAYRTGARQAFSGGASILYRRSNVDQAYQPDSAGMPDVAIGGLGLAELLSPGTVDTVLTGFYPSCSPCAADFDGSGFVDTDDFDAFMRSFEAGTDDADFDGSGFVDTDDFDAFVRAFELGC